jgi:hypothetical protein
MLIRTDTRLLSASVIEQASRGIRRRIVGSASSILPARLTAKSDAASGAIVRPYQA